MIFFFFFFFKKLFLKIPANDKKRMQNNNKGHARAAMWSEQMPKIQLKHVSVTLLSLCASSEGSDETVHMRRLVWALAARQCDK